MSEPSEPPRPAVNRRMVNVNRKSTGGRADLPGQSVGPLLFRELPSNLKFSAEEKRTLRTFARTIAARVAGGGAFTCVISDDNELRELNRTYLGHDYATDVLSFPYGPSGPNLGELIISVERAEAQAAEFGHSRIDEICILMLHGLLHLTGMDHEKDRGEMAQAEDKWREELGLPLALIARAGA